MDNNFREGFRKIAAIGPAADKILKFRAAKAAQKAAQGAQATGGTGKQLWKETVKKAPTGYSKHTAQKFAPGKMNPRRKYTPENVSVDAKKTGF